MNFDVITQKRQDIPNVAAANRGRHVTVCSSSVVVGSSSSSSSRNTRIVFSGKLATPAS